MSSQTRPRRVVIFDRTQRGHGVFPGLSRIWRSGGWLYQALGRVDDRLGAGSWPEALCGLLALEAPISELQIWAHGKWGDARLGDDRLDARALSRPSSELVELRRRLSPNALIWFRTCETFGADRGQRFAREAADFFGCTVAGHTYVIGYWQSGLHVLRPGAAPCWDSEEGLMLGTAARPERALPSTPFAPNTITCLDGSVPPHST